MSEEKSEHGRMETYRFILQKTPKIDTGLNEEDRSGHEIDDGRNEDGGECSYTESILPRGGVCGIYRTIRDDAFPTESERKAYYALHRRNYRRNNEPWRDFEWGSKPKGFREWRDYHYIFWRRSYLDYLIILHDRFMKKVNSYKDFSKKKISLEKFIEFAYINSSGYITQYA